MNRLGTISFFLIFVSLLTLPNHALSSPTSDLKDMDKKLASAYDNFKDFYENELLTYETGKIKKRYWNSVKDLKSSTKKLKKFQNI